MFEKEINAAEDDFSDMIWGYYDSKVFEKAGIYAECVERHGGEYESWSFVTPKEKTVTAYE